MELPRFCLVFSDKTIVSSENIGTIVNNARTERFVRVAGGHVYIVILAIFSSRI